MKTGITLLIVILCIFAFQACDLDNVYAESYYYNTLSFSDSSASHPKNLIYQSLVDEYVENGGIGMSIMIHDEYGTWLGTGGYADIKSGINMEKGHQFLIASTSKLITATAVFACIEDGVINLNDSVTKWLDISIVEKIENASGSTIKHLLGHRSGIRDIYNLKHLMPYMNIKEHQWIDEDMLRFVHGDQAYYEVDEGWYYSNINYILLGMIMEEATGLSLKEIYQQKIFDPLQLNSAYYDTGNDALPEGLIKGYTDINSNNIFVEADEFYEDDIGLGGDGGIAMNAQDLGVFMNKLMNGGIINQNSLDSMQSWFEGGYSTNGHAGYGLYRWQDEYGESVGHDGGFIGFESFLEHYTEQNITIVKLFNTDLILTTEEYDDVVNLFLRELRKEIFK